MEPRHFKNPPIREAIFDLRIKPLPDEGVERFAEPTNEFLSRYPTRKNYIDVTGAAHIELHKDRIPEQPLTRRQFGYVFHSPDGKEIVQFRLDGFTFNRLEPYVSWEDMRAKAFLALEEYESLTTSIIYTRAALRYINRIQLPNRRFEFEDFFLCPPKTPENTIETVPDFLSRIHMFDEKTKESAVLIQTLAHPPGGEILEWIIDIDASVNTSARLPKPELIEIFDRLRDLKNRVFFGCIKDEILEVVKWQ